MAWTAQSLRKVGWREALAAAMTSARGCLASSSSSNQCNRQEETILKDLFNLHMVEEILVT